MNFEQRAAELKRRLQEPQPLFTISCDLCGSLLVNNYDGHAVVVSTASEANYIGGLWGWFMSDGGRYGVCVECAKPVVRPVASKHPEAEEVDTTNYRRLSLNQINDKLDKTRKKLEGELFPYVLGIIEPDVWD